MPTPEEIAANQARLKEPWGERVILDHHVGCQVGGEMLIRGSAVYRRANSRGGGPLDQGNPNRGIEWNYRCAYHAHQREAQ